MSVGIDAGIAWDAGDKLRFRRDEALLWGIAAVWCSLIGLAFGFFGRQMVRIAEVSATEIGREVQGELQTKGGGEFKKVEGALGKAIIKVGPLFGCSITCACIKQQMAF